MARTHSSYTASPTRLRSPQRSPARRASQDGSQYEMDLDALGLNSTFESAELEGSYEPPVERVDTSEIEGPEDFTMNMTYWMTADLPLAQVMSRKEANRRRSDLRMDAMQERDEVQGTMEEGDRAIIEEESTDRNGGSTEPIMCAKGITGEREHNYSTSERSMENNEKVRSFLSALPDTDMEGVLTGTPRHKPKQSFLQVPRSSPPKARSLQATVEDYNTPRKPTQETVIHHTSTLADAGGQGDQIAGLQSQLEQQHLASRTRIVELETILSYTRMELENARTDNFRHKERLAILEQSIERQNQEQEASRLAAEAQLKMQEDALNIKMQEYGDELRLQNLAKLQNQREDYDHQLRALEESKRLVDEEVDRKGQTLEKFREDLAQLRHSNESEHPNKMLTQSRQDPSEQNAQEERERLAEQLSLVQNRANKLQALLENAIVKARVAHEDGQRKDAMYSTLNSRVREQALRLSDLESHLRTTQFELECAQTDIAAKQQLFQTNLDLNSRLRILQSELDSAQTKISLRDQQSLTAASFESRINALQCQLESTRTELASKDQQLIHYIESQERFEQDSNNSRDRIKGIETTLITLRQQLAEAHRESAKARTKAERLEKDLDDTNERHHESCAEATRRVADMEKKLTTIKESKREAWHRFEELQTQHDHMIHGHEAMMEDVREKAEDAVRKTGALLAQERNEKKRLIKDIRRTKDEVVRLRDEVARNMIGEESSDEVSSTSNTMMATSAKKDSEILALREIIQKQVAEMKTVKSEAAAAWNENKKLKSNSESSLDLKTTIITLESQLGTLREENSALLSRLTTQKEDNEAVNRAMDDKLADMLSKLMRERAKAVVCKRDGQWVETVGKVRAERELLGKVLMRQLGREEVGVAEEKNGQKQGYVYKYIKRTA